MPLYPLRYPLFSKDKGDHVSPSANFPMKCFWKYSIAIGWLTRFVLESQTSMVYTEVCRRWRYIVPWISIGHPPGEVLLEIFDHCRLGACGTTLSWNHKLRRYTLLHVAEDGRHVVLKSAFRGNVHLALQQSDRVFSTALDPR